MNSNQVPKIFKITLIDNGYLNTYVLDGVVDNEWYDIFNTYQQNFIEPDYAYLVYEFLMFFTGQSKDFQITRPTVEDIAADISLGKQSDSKEQLIAYTYNKYGKPEYYGWWKNGTKHQRGFIYTTDSVYHIYLDIDSY